MHPYFVILGSALLGVALSLFLRRSRKSNHSRKHSTCPPYLDCALVLNSKYADFFKMPVEVLGIIYYAFIFVLYMLMAAFPFFNHPFGVFVVVGMSAVAILFSLYLTVVQLITLKTLCRWCLASTALCLSIFLSAITLSSGGLIPLLAQFKPVLLVLHLIGFALGVGGATITDYFFFKFLKDFKISKFESRMIHSVSDLIWFGLGLLILTGLALYLPDAEALGQSAKFLAKMILVFIITINGIFLNLYISPKLAQISFHKKHKHKKGELHKYRRFAFASGAVSFTSWYLAFIFASLSRSQPFTLAQLMVIYLLVLVVTVTGSQLIERYFHWKANN